jgi:hypothetical protein
MNKLLLFLFISIFAAFQLNAATRTASASGNWNNTTTWGGAAVPTSADIVNINAGITVTVNVTASCSTLTVGTSGGAQSFLNINSGITLTVVGTITIPNAVNGGTPNTLGVGAGILDATGQTIAINGSNSTRQAAMTISSGTATASSITFANTNSLLTFTGTGILNLGGTGTALGTGGTFTRGTGTVNFNRSGTQTVAGYTYNNLTLSGTSSKTTTGITVNGILSMEGDATVSLSATPTYGSAATLQYKGSGTLTTTTVEFPNNFSGTGGLIIDQGTGNTINLNASKTALAGNLNIKSGTLNLSTFTANRASGTLTLTITGTLKLSGTSGGQTGSNFPTGYTTLTMTGGTVDYAAATGLQTIYATPAYNNLTLENTSGASTAGNNLTVNGTLTTTAGGTLDMSTYTLTGSLTSVTNGGTIKTSCTTNPPFSSGVNWGSSGTIEYAVLAGGQYVPAGTFFNLKFNNTSLANTAVGNVVVNGTLTIPSGGTLNMSTFTLTGTLATVTNAGIIKTSCTTNPSLASGVNWGSAGLIEYAVLTGGQYVPAGTFYNLKFDNTSLSNTAVGNLSINGALTTTSGGTLDLSTFTLGGTLATITNPGTIKTSNTSSTPIPTGKTWGGTVNYTAGSGSQTVMSGTYSTLTLSNSSGTNTASNNIAASTVNNISGGILDMVGYTLSVSGTINNAGSTIRFNSTNGFAISTGTVEYYGATQNLPAGNYNNLTISTSGTKTLTGATFVAGALKINSGATLDANSRTITITGAGLAWNNLGSFTYGTSKVKMNGSSPQSMFGSTFYDLEIDNTAGVTLTSSDIVTHLLILTNGLLTLGNNDLTVSGSIVGAGSSKYIITDGTGTLIQNVGSSAVTFPVGLVASDYTPITFSNSGTQQNYNVRIRSVTPNIATTGLYRQWVVKETSASTTTLSSVALSWTATSAGTLGNPATCDMVANTTGNAGSYDKIYEGLNGSTFSVSTPSMVYPLQDITTGLYITVVGDNSLLPVELSSFASSVNGRDVSLNWTTKTEKNSNKFEIERSVNLNWVNIGSVKASVLSNSPKQYSFTDKNLQSGKYQYRLKMIDNDGSFTYSKVVEAAITLPKEFELSQNYPNPFNPSTKINYSLPNDSRVTLEIYNIIGERVALLVNEIQSAGFYTVNFGTSFNNIGSGIYIYKITAVDNSGKNFSSVKKMMLLK